MTTYMTKKPSPLLAVLIMLLFLSGCQAELYSGLTEEEANLMLSTLLERDIATEKISKGKNGFTIAVDQKDVVRALDLLSVSGLPRPVHQSLGQVFSGQGMISSPLEEQSRLSFALSQELAETFSRIDGVLTARAHVVLTSYNQASNTTAPASAAIFLRHAPDSPVVNMGAKIKEICAQAVPSLDINRISIMLVPVRTEVVLAAEPKAGAQPVALFVGLGLAILIILGLLFFIYRQNKKNQNQPATV